jgi:hypothetical protein
MVTNSSSKLDIGHPYSPGPLASVAFSRRADGGENGVVLPEAAQAGRSKHWIKVNNRKHPAMDRVADSFR